MLLNEGRYIRHYVLCGHQWKKSGCCTGQIVCYTQEMRESRKHSKLLGNSILVNYMNKSNIVCIIKRNYKWKSKYQGQLSKHIQCVSKGVISCIAMGLLVIHNKIQHM